MTELKEDYELWDKFLTEWPIERLETMTLEEYVGEEGTLMHWVGARLARLGSTWGGYAGKYGIHIRKRTGSKRPNLVLSDRHYWPRSLGANSAEAFARLKSEIVRCAQAGKAGRLEEIDAATIPHSVIRWKLAFLYQPRDNPQIVNVFNKEQLLVYARQAKFAAMADSKMSTLQRAAIANRPEGRGILEYGRLIDDIWLANRQASNRQKRPGTSLGASTGAPQSVSGQPFAKERRELNQIFYGPPGTGKTRKLMELKSELDRQTTDGTDGLSVKYYEFVTFHQSYGYEEFVEGLRPVLRDAEKGERGGDVGYEIRDGVFKALCDRARNNPGKRFAIFIDEINRGNVSKIFGELITLIEPDKRYRDPGNPGLSVKLPYSQTEFSVPVNVEIYGSMNTADRSLTVLDTALRRRFEFIECPPDTSESGPIGEQSFVDAASKPLDINIRQMLETMNRRIEVLFDRDHRIGHAYFLGLKEAAEPMNALAEVFKKRIVPLLQEYFFDDWQKIRLVLGDNQKNDPDHQFVREVSESTGTENLFGLQERTDRLRIPQLYEVNERAFGLPKSYIGIYAPSGGA